MECESHSIFTLVSELRTTAHKHSSEKQVWVTVQGNYHILSLIKLLDNLQN